MNIYGEDAGMDDYREDFSASIFRLRSARRDPYLPGISSRAGRTLNMAAAKLRRGR